MEAQHCPTGSRRLSFAAAPAAFVFASVCLCAAATPLAAQVVPVSDEIAVSQTDGDYESLANIAADRNGNWGVAWQAERLDFSHATGRQRRVLRHGEFLPGSLIDVPLQRPDLGLDGEGYGVLVGIVDRPELGGAEIDAYCTDIQGMPASGLVRVDTGTISPATRLPSDVRVATDSDRRSVVVWQENPRVADVPPSIFFRRLSGRTARPWERSARWARSASSAGVSRTSHIAATAASCWSGSKASRRRICRFGRSSSTMRARLSLRPSRSRRAVVGRAIRRSP